MAKPPKAHETQQTNSEYDFLLKDVTIRGVPNGFIIMTAYRKVKNVNGENQVVGATADEQVASDYKDALRIAADWFEA